MITTRFARLREEIAALLPGTTVNAARRLYNDLGHQAIGVCRELDSPAARHTHHRSSLLLRLAALEGQMSDAYRAGWTTQPGDQAIADDTGASADLLHLIVSTEVAEGPEFRIRGEDDWEAAFGIELDALTGVTDLAARIPLMDALYTAVDGTLGDQVAETVYRVRTAYHRIITANAARLAIEAGTGSAA